MTLQETFEMAMLHRDRNTLLAALAVINQHAFEMKDTRLLLVIEAALDKLEAPILKMKIA